jgi:hypothetical protein
MENRRLRLKDGKEADIRRAYSVPRDEDVAAVGPVDTEIGILRLDRLDGSTLAVIYNFACHPIMGVPSGGNTADITGFASKAIEESLGGEAMAIFLQGCAGDIHPVLYKDVDHPADAEPLGNLLGLSTLKVVQNIDTKSDAPLRLIHEVVELPRADHTQRIYSLEAEQAALLQSLKGTTLNFKKFLPLIVKYQVFSDFPSGESHRYLHDELIKREDWKQLDAANRKHMQQYLDNIYVMEQLTRLQANLALLKKHQARNAAADKRTIDVELLGLRIGDFALVTHPGEPTVQIGLNLKQASPHEHTFVAGYTNGYIYYAPTAEQLSNAGAAQEDSDCLLAPEWQKIYESKALEVLNKL